MANLDQLPPRRQHRILGVSPLAFAVCFGVWTTFSIIGVRSKRDLGR